MDGRAGTRPVAAAPRGRELFLTTLGISAALQIASDLGDFEPPAWIVVPLVAVWAGAGVVWAWTAFRSRGEVPREERRDAVKGWLVVVVLLALLPLGALVGLWEW